jgi:hypothetical protein
MDELKIRHAVGVLVSLVIVGTAIALSLLNPSIYDSILAYAPHGAALSPVRLSAPQQLEFNVPSKLNTNGGSQSNVLELPNGGLQSNVLELPKASLDFVGNWGAYTHSTVYSVVPGALVAKGPDRISVTFGYQGGTVFVASELYTAPNQQIIGRPRAWMSDSTEASIEYEARDRELYYVYLHRFTLLSSGKISYAEKVDIYERRTHSWVGLATQHALLEQLTTLDQRRKFARPSPFEVSKGEVSAGKSFAFPGSLDPGLTSKR